MKKALLFFILCTSSVAEVVFAQSTFLLSDFDLDNSQKSRIGIRAEGLSNSTALSGKATNAGLFGGYITEEERQFMLDRSKEENITGNFSNLSVYFAHRIDSLDGDPKSHLTYFFQVTDRQEINALFSQDALSVALFGNKQFAGDTAKFSPLSYNQYRYNQLQMGINKTYSNGFKFGLGLSFIYGQSNISGTSPQLYVYTTPTGDQIKGAAKVVLNQTDPQHRDLFAYNGAGASMDLSINFPIHLISDSTRPARFIAAISDLGFVNWNSKSEEFLVDSVFTYSGSDISNVFDPAGGITSGTPGDYLDSISTKTHVAYTSVLPYTIFVQLKQEFQNSEVSVGLTFRDYANYSAFFFTTYSRFFGEHWNLGGQVNFGGYGKLGFGVHAGFDSKKIVAKLGSSNVEGFINPKKWAGQSLFLTLGYKIGKNE